MRSLLLFLFTISVSLSSKSENIISDSLIVAGPMVGFVTDTSALIWIEVNSPVKDITINYWKKNDGTKQSVSKSRHEQRDSVAEKIFLHGLLPNTVYQFNISVNGVGLNKIPQPQFKTDIKEASDFSFLLGSCLYINDENDHKKRPYGGSLRILGSMAKEETDFMLWLGDNVYFRPSDCRKVERMKRRYTSTRTTPELQPLISTRANYATWDDHDFGLDNSGSDFTYAEASLNIFKSYWGNRYFGNEDKGVFSTFTRGDCQFFLTDDRFFRTVPKTDNPKALKEECADKDFFGKEQMEWLKRKLKESGATFKFVVVGNQVLNMKAEKECFYYYKKEYEELLNFISENKVEGVIFLSGDRHFSELIKNVPKGGYPLYDFTCSALTSQIRNVNKTSERDNPQRVANTLVLEHNFGKIKVTGEKGKRKLIMSTHDKKGKIIWDYQIEESELKFQ